MFDFDQENDRRVTDTDPDALKRSPEVMQGRKSGPSFAGLRPPWDPLSGKPMPWGDDVFDPIMGHQHDHGGDPLLDAGALGAAASPLLAGVPTAHPGHDAKGQNDAPELPEREKPRQPAHAGEADDAPVPPARELQKPQKRPGDAEDQPVDRSELREKEKPHEEGQHRVNAHSDTSHQAHGNGDGAAGTSEDESAAHHTRGTPSPSERDHQMGHALPNAMHQMEQSFGEDLSGVGVTDEMPQEMRGAGAKAVAVDNLIAFDPGAMNFDRPEGKRLLAHELAHVIQKRRGNKQPQKESTKAKDESQEHAPPEQDETKRHQLEHDAEQAAAKAVRGSAARVMVGAAAPQNQFSGLKGLWDKAKQGGQWALDQWKRVNTSVVGGFGALGNKSGSMNAMRSGLEAPSAGGPLSGMNRAQSGGGTAGGAFDANAAYRGNRGQLFGGAGGGVGGGTSGFSGKKGDTAYKGTQGSAGAALSARGGADYRGVGGSADLNAYSGGGGSTYSFSGGGKSGKGFEADLTPIGLANSTAKAKLGALGQAEAKVGNAYYNRATIGGETGTDKAGNKFGGGSASLRTGLDNTSLTYKNALWEQGLSVGHLSQGVEGSAGGKYNPKTGAWEGNASGFGGVRGKDLGASFSTKGANLSANVGDLQYGYGGQGSVGYDPKTGQVTATGSGRGGGLSIANSKLQGGIDGVGTGQASLGRFSTDQVVEGGKAVMDKDHTAISADKVDFFVGGGMRFEDFKGGFKSPGGSVAGNASFESIGNNNTLEKAYLNADYKNLRDPSLKAGFENLAYGNWSGSKIHLDGKGPGDSRLNADLGEFGQGIFKAQGASVDLSKRGLDARAEKLGYNNFEAKGLNVDAGIGDSVKMHAGLGEGSYQHFAGEGAKLALNKDGLDASLKKGEYDMVHLKDLDTSAKLGSLYEQHARLGEGHFQHGSAENVNAGLNLDKGLHASLDNGKYSYLGGKNLDVGTSMGGGLLKTNLKAGEASLGGVDVGHLDYNTTLKNSNLTVNNLGAHGWKSKDVDVSQEIAGVGANVKAKELNALDLNVGKLDAHTQRFGTAGNATVEQARLDALKIKDGHVGLGYKGQELAGATGSFQSGAGVDKAQAQYDLLKGQASGSFKNANTGAQLSDASLNFMGHKLALPDAGYKVNASGAANINARNLEANAGLNLKGSNVNLAGHKIELGDWAQASGGVKLTEGAANVNLGGKNGIGANMNLSKGELAVNAFGYNVDVAGGIKSAGSSIASGASSLWHSIWD